MLKAFTSELPCHRQQETLSVEVLLEARGEERWKGHGQGWKDSPFCCDGEALLPQWCYGLRALPFPKQKQVTAMISYVQGSGKALNCAPTVLPKYSTHGSN